MRVLNLAAGLLALVSALPAAEIAAFDSLGRLTAMIYSGEELAVAANAGLATRGWARLVPIGPADRTSLRADPDARTWSGPLEVEAGRAAARFRQVIRQHPGALEIRFELQAEQDLDGEAVLFWIDLPQPAFSGGRADVLDGTGLPESVPLPEAKPPQTDFFTREARVAHLLDRAGALDFRLEADRIVPLALRDVTSGSARAIQIRLTLHRGTLAKGAVAAVTLRLSLDGVPDSSPATVRLDPAQIRYLLHGFGGNYCFNIESPVTQYTLRHLKVRWARTEMTLTEWEPQNDNDSAEEVHWDYLMGQDKPGSNLRREFQLARQIQDLGIPYAVAIWRLPEWLYTDPGQQGPSAQRRRVDPAKWDELLECIGSYLLYARDQYGVEPDLFSFNEGNIGVYVLFTAEEHRDAIKSIGAHLERMGLKTRMLLADATGPRGTHIYALPAAEDAEALRYVRAIGFHSWGGATPAQYQAWGDLAERLGLPLLVAELGVDAAAWRNRVYDSFHYGLREVRMYQELLLHARPQGTMHWELTSDYGSVATRQADGQTELLPTHRFWFQKHFFNLTPPNADALAVSCTHAKVLATAFRAADGGRTDYTLHVANFGAAREVVIEGLPEEIRSLRVVATSESHEYQELEPVRASGNRLSFLTPPRSLVTLTTLEPE